ncbi:hypothetical protein BJ166DRAFT_194826 [Pestalotiopsis sp. NC0098]|nr:hypothetical protein BJ166DRAFT_194826 [Pestalotiopsis sp. NC0098]
MPRTCVLAFTNRALEDNGKLPLPISRRLYEHIVDTFDIPTTFLATLSTGLATYESTISSARRQRRKDSAPTEFILQQNSSYCACSMGVAFNFVTGHTRILLFGVEPWFVSRLFDYLGSMTPLPEGPMLVPTIAMELQALWFSNTIKDCRSQIYAIETATGMRQGFSNSQDWKNLDLISITRDLSSFLSRSAKQTAFCNDQFDIILKLEQIQSMYHGIAARCQYLTDRATAQSQTVHCLIASKDNLTNIEIAKASHRIAEESQRDNEGMRALAELGRQDNQLMIQVAKDSRAVAVATARDSAAMQVIAAVTILFLPATFIALAWAGVSKRRGIKITRDIALDLEDR